MFRVSHRDIYTNLVGNLNQATSRLMELNIQAASQKKVNKPSDDPVGMARILDYRNSIASLQQYQTNIDTAKGWLGLADQTLMQVNTVVTRARTLAEQGATGTMTQENREAIAFEVRQLFDQLVTLSNAEYEGQSIFAGHKTKDNAFEKTLALDVRNTNWELADDEFFGIGGNTDRTIAVQFLDDGQVTGGVVQGALTDPPLNYRYSSDGGLTWANGSIERGASTLDLGGVTVELAGNATIDGSGTDNTKMNEGTWLVVRPSAEYKGDDEDEITVDRFLGSGSTVADSSAQGSFPKDVLVRIDNAWTSAAGGTLEYAYSLDGGNTWTSGQTTETTAPATEATLLVSGGKLTLDATGLNPGDQFGIRPNRARMNVEIGPGQTIQINSIGKDIFGGIYQSQAVSFSTADANLFETLGKLVAAFETNDQAGIQSGLAGLKSAQQHVNTQLASVGARENRLDIADTVLSGLELNQEERLSKIEDVDLAELMTKLANQQMTYEAVLRSSSMIMKMSMVNYV
ncbi:MAG: flagellar hook-associated protein 3 [Deltaproteobacteria bacterium]|nr:flagellar hook-associated protein 3 [Deltaproteobacteria bacterium]